MNLSPPQLCSMFWEDPLCCHWDGLTLPKSKFPLLFPFVSICLLLVWVLLPLSSSVWFHHPLFESSLDSLYLSTASSVGCSPLLPPAVGFQCLAVAGGVPQGGALGAWGPRSGLPAPHSAGHPVRLWHRQGRQATGHHHHSWEETVTQQMHGWIDWEGRGRKNRSMHGGGWEGTEGLLGEWWRRIMWPH